MKPRPCWRLCLAGKLLKVALVCIGTFGTTGAVLAMVIIIAGGSPIVAAAPPLPDFVITGVSCPAEIVAGLDMTVYVTVKNRGSAAGDGKYVDVWQNQTNGWPRVGEVGEGWEPVGHLEPGTARTIAVSPFKAQLGTNNLCAFVEFENRVSETVNTNNHLCVTYYGAPVTTNVTPVYRFWSAVFRGHFFTISASEKTNIIDNLSRDWRYEGIAFYVPRTQVPGTAPVYRFWSPVYKGHFFTMSAREKTNIIENLSHDWRYEGIAYHTYPFRVEGASPVFRFWSPRYRHHFFTISEPEKNSIIANLSHDWNYEGIAYYAFRTPPGVSAGALGAMAAFSSQSAPAAPVTGGADGYGGVVGADAFTVTGDAATLPFSALPAADFVLPTVLPGEGAVSFPVEPSGTQVAAYIYDFAADAWTNLLDHATTSTNAVFGGVKVDRDYLLEVWSEETDGAGPRLVHQSHFIRSRFPPEGAEGDAAAPPDPQEGVGLPTESIVMPPCEGTLTVMLCMPETGATETLPEVTGGETIELQLTSWDRWHWLGAWRDSDGELVLSLWLRHSRE